jgi:uncharacterized protein (TIGR00661 family)
LKRNDQKSKKTAVPSNCVVKDFSEQGFVDDLATSQAVVCNGGLSLIGEALYLGKPIMSVPVRNQFEQVMNARYLEELGYGLGCESIEPQVLRLFLRERDKYAGRVAKHKQKGNDRLFEVIDALVKKTSKRAKK